LDASAGCYWFSLCCASATDPSQSFIFLSPVFVSTPEISVTGRVILGQPFQILCQSLRGSLPIVYTLFKDYQQIGRNIVQNPRDKALFTVTINHTREISKFICEANNKNSDEGLLSGALNATVIGKYSNLNERKNMLI